MKRATQPQRYITRNTVAILVAILAVGSLHFDLQTLAVGDSQIENAERYQPPLLSIPPSPELPKRARDAANETAEQTDATQEGDETTVAADSSSHSDDGTLRGVWALKMAMSIIEKGVDSFGKIPDYTASFYKQERKGGVLSDGQTIEMKLKQEPFSVYMKWLSGDNRGQQVIYADGQNDGKLLVQPGGIKGRLTGVLSLDPLSSLAMAQSRHPVTQVGLTQLAKKILKHQSTDLKRENGFYCELVDGHQFADRDCYVFTCAYDNEQVNPEYRKCVVYIDKELAMPVCVQNYCWAIDANPETIDEETLLEFYAYSDLELIGQVDVADFDPKNREYRMRLRR